MKGFIIWDGLRGLVAGLVFGLAGLVRDGILGFSLLLLVSCCAVSICCVDGEIE